MTTGKRILFIAQHRTGRSPSQRFRFEQYLDFLRSVGFTVSFSYLLEESDDRSFYSKGYFLKKAAILLKSYRKRLSDLRAAPAFDFVYIQREAFMTGSTFFERLVKKRGPRLIFDFDDSIWLQNVSEANQYLNFLKNPAKTSRIIAMSDLVVAGNNYLADYAKKYNSSVQIIPTTIDTESYKPIERSEREYVAIGWSGSITTIQHFQYSVPVLMRIKARFGEKVRIDVIGDGSYSNRELGIQGKPWVAATELEDLCDFDIGIMPLPDDEWAKGKCGLKGLQYMALGIPTVMSPVGVNSEIIQHGMNGFLATSEDEWFNVLARLIEDADLRKRIGSAGRQTVVDRYSVEANKEKYLKLFK